MTWRLCAEAGFVEIQDVECKGRHFERGATDSARGQEMKLSELVPLAEIEQSLGEELKVEHFNTQDLDEIISNYPDDTFGISASTWNRIVFGGRIAVDPKQLANYFDSEDPAIARAISRAINAQVIKDFGNMRATVHRGGGGFEVATSTVAQLFSDELHLYDISLCDPRKPLDPSARKSDIHHHGGFGLLGKVIDNLMNIAKERGCSVVTLTAANMKLANIFKRHGFLVEKNKMAKLALQMGVTIPMERKL